MSIAQELHEAIEPTLPREVVVEERMGQGIRVELINVHPGDFGGYGGQRRDFQIIVTGDTQPVRDQLKKFGLWWDGKQNAWVMKSGYSGYTGKQWGEPEEKVKETLKKVQDFAKAHNDAVQKANQGKITGMGMEVHTISAERPKEMMKHLSSLERANARLKKHGVVIEYEFPDDMGGALGGIQGSYNVWVIGDTYSVKDQLKEMGFTFGKSVPSKTAERAKKSGVKKADAGWTMDGATFARIDKQAIERLIRAFEGTLEGENMSLAQELREAVEDGGGFTTEEMEAFLREHPGLFHYGSEDDTAMEDALNAMDRLLAEGVGDDMLRYIGRNPEMLALVVEGVSVPEAMDLLGEAEKKGGFEGSSEGNPGNDPFKTAPLHGTSSAGIGGGRANPRTKTGECESCKCGAQAGEPKYVCICQCGGREKRVDMRKYATAKKAYMAHWRGNHGPQHPR